MNTEDKGELKVRMIFGIILYTISCLIVEFVFKGTGWHVWSMITFTIGLTGMLHIIVSGICLLEGRT